MTLMLCVSQSEINLRNTRLTQFLTSPPSFTVESFKNPKDYLRQVPAGSWSVDSILKGYANHYSNLSSHDLLKKIELDLEDTSKERPHQASAVRQWKSTFKSLYALLDRETKDTIVNTNKLADTWDSHGSVTVHQTAVVESSKRKKHYDSLEALTVKKGRKLFDFTAQMKPSISTHKPRMSNEDQAQLSPLYAVKIHDTHASNTPEVLVQKYEDNKNAQAEIQSLMKRSIAHQFLKQALCQPLNDLRHYLWTYGDEEECSAKEKLEIELIRLILTDFTAICMKPSFPVPTNERTPFVESIVPIFKYLSSTMGSIAFVWCEKGLSLCVPHATKLLDGIGMTMLDQVDRILIESSGLKDGAHTEEDTLKLLEYTSMCLQAEKSRYQQASYNTYSKRKFFALQFVGYKLTLLSTCVVHDHRWACVWERSSLIPHRWSERKYWYQAFELIFTLKDMIEEQDVITEQLIDEHTGTISVRKEETLRAHYTPVPE